MEKGKRMTKNDFSSAGRARYVRPTIESLGMDNEDALLLTVSGGSSNSSVSQPTDNTSNDNNTGRGSDYPNVWQ